MIENIAREMAPGSFGMAHFVYPYPQSHMDVSENSVTPKSSILIGFSIINHPFWGIPIFGNNHIPKGKPENHGFLKSDGFLMVKCVIVFSGG